MEEQEEEPQMVTVIEQLPTVIGDAIWHQLQKATETCKTDILLKGELEICLPSWNIAVSLNHTFKGQNVKQPNEAKSSTTHNCEAGDAPLGTDDTTKKETKAKSKSKIDQRLCSQPKDKQHHREELDKSPTLEELRGSDENYDPAEDSDEDYETSNSVIKAKEPRVSSRLRKKTETLGRLDFSKGLQRLQTKPLTKTKVEAEDELSPKKSYPRKRGLANEENEELEARNAVEETSQPSKKPRPDLTTKRPAKKPSNIFTFLEKGRRSILLETTVTCAICERVFKGTRNINRHAKQHRDVCLRCGLCNETINDCELMRAHIESHQREEFTEVPEENDTELKGTQESNQTNNDQMTNTGDKTIYVSIELEDDPNTEVRVGLKPRGRPQKYPKPDQTERTSIEEDVKGSEDNIVGNNENAAMGAMGSDADIKDLEDPNEIHDSEDTDKAKTPDVKNVTVSQTPNFRVVSAKRQAKPSTAKSFTCEICHESFNKRSTLQDHMFVHNRQSEHQCDLCGRTFPRDYKLQKHREIQHNIDMKPKPNLQSHQSETEQSIDTKQEDNPEEAETDISLAEELNSSSSVEKSTVEDTTFPCEICQKVFKSMTRLNEHMFIHRKESKFFCNHCYTRVPSFSKLETHLKIAHNQTLTKESFRKLFDEFLPPEGCVGFVTTHHDVNTSRTKLLVMKCTTCSQFEGTRDAAVEHMKTHSDRCIYHCEYCDLAFQYSATLRIHQTYMHKGEFKNKCQICSQVFGRLEELVSHSSKEHDVIIAMPKPKKQKYIYKKTFPCEHCGQVFRNKGRLQGHVMVVHEKKEKPYKCTECSKRFLREDILRDHMFIHTRQSRFMCEVCGKVFQKRFELLQHRHLDDPWRCELCQKVFTTYNGYKLHLRKHTEVPSHMCKFCGAQFFFKTRLENHERTHTGEKPFQCTTCSARFGDLYTFNKHKKLHTKPMHKCPHCEKSYPYQGQLQTHMQIHSKDRERFQCDLCKKSYFRKEILLKHRATHEQQAQKLELFYQCSVCENLYTSKAQCLKCKNSHYQIANAVADVIDTEVSTIDGTVQNATIPEDSHVLVLNVDGVEHQYVIEQNKLIQGADQQLISGQIVINQDEELQLSEVVETNQAVQIINNDQIEIEGNTVTETDDSSQYEVIHDQIQVINSGQLEVINNGQIEVLNGQIEIDSDQIQIINSEQIEVLNDQVKVSQEHTYTVEMNEEQITGDEFIEIQQTVQ